MSPCTARSRALSGIRTGFDGLSLVLERNSVVGFRFPLGCNLAMQISRSVVEYLVPFERGD